MEQHGTENMAAVNTAPITQRTLQVAGSSPASANIYLPKKIYIYNKEFRFLASLFLT